MQQSLGEWQDQEEEENLVNTSSTKETQQSVVQEENRTKDEDEVAEEGVKKAAAVEESVAVSTEVTPKEIPPSLFLRNSILVSQLSDLPLSVSLAFINTLSDLNLIELEAFIRNGANNQITKMHLINSVDASRWLDGPRSRDASVRLIWHPPWKTHIAKDLTILQGHLKTQKSWSEPINNGANFLVTVFGGGDGLSGVLVCAENFVIYKNQGHPNFIAVTPRPLFPNNHQNFTSKSSLHPSHGQVPPQNRHLPLFQWNPLDRHPNHHEMKFWDAVCLIISTVVRPVILGESVNSSIKFFVDLSFAAMKENKVKEGMVDGGCAASVKRILENQPQLSSASVNLTIETVLVWPLLEATISQNWQQHLGEALPNHLLAVGLCLTFEIQEEAMSSKSLKRKWKKSIIT